MQSSRLEHAITAAVALGIAGLGLAEGGFAPTAYAATSVLVWGAVLIGLAAGAFPRAPVPVVAVVAGLLIAGFAALVALSITWASDNGRAFEDAVRASAYTGVFVLVVAASRRGEASAWLRGIAIGLVAIAAIALAARFEPGLFGNPDASLQETLPAARGRLTYPIGYWNGLAAAMATAVVLLIWIGAAGRHPVGRALATAAMPIVLLALWATDSRGGIVAAALAVAVLVAFGPRRLGLVFNALLGVGAGVALVALASRRDDLFNFPGSPGAESEAGGMLLLTVLVVLATGLIRWALDRPLGSLAAKRVPRGVLRVAAAATAIGALAAIIAIDPVQRFEDFKRPPSGEEIGGSARSDLLRTGGSGRYQFWEAAVDGFADAPVGGLGAGGYGPYWLEHRQYPLSASRAHSLVFETLAELGLGGLALVIGFLATAAVSAIRRRRAAAPAPEIGPAAGVLAVGILACAVDWTWDLPAVFVATVVAVALLVGPATLSGAQPVPPARAWDEARSRRRFAGGVGVLMVAWLSICAAGLLLLADHSLEASREAAARDDIEAAIEAAANARDLEPWAAEPRTQLALLYERGGDATEALQAILEAIDRSPRDFELYLLKARIELVAGNADAARESFQIARRLNPLDPAIRAVDSLIRG